MSNLPINWQDKVNSPELLAYLQQFGEKSYLSAEEINQLRDAINELGQGSLPDAVLKSGTISITGLAVNIAANAFAWRINQQEFLTPAAYGVNLTAAADGYYRADIIVGTSTGTYQVIQGNPSTTSAIEPDAPDGTIRLAGVVVFGLVVGTPTPTPTTNFVEKSERANVILTGSGVINMLTLADEKATVVFKGSVTRLNTITYPNIPYNGKRITLFNAQNTPVTIGNAVSGYAVDFIFPDGQDYVLQPNQTIEFSFDMTYAPYAHHMYIGNVAKKTTNVTTEPSITKTLAATDEHVLFTNANAVTFTIPTNASVPIPVGTKVRYTQQGDGIVSVAGAGITFVTNLPLAMVKGETRILTKIGTDTWTVEGNIPDVAKQSYTVFVDITNGNDANGIFENKSKPFKNLDNALASLPADNGKSWMIVFLSSGNYPCSSFPNRNLEFDSDYLVDIDFTNSPLDYVALGVAKFYRFYSGKISLKSQKITFQQFSVGNVPINGASIEGHINEIKWECPSSSAARTLLHIDQFNGVSLKINKLNTYTTNVAGSVLSFSTTNGNGLYNTIEILEYVSSKNIALLSRISTSGNAFQNLIIRNIVGNSNLSFNSIDTILFLKASGTGNVTFGSVNTVKFDNTPSTANFNFSNVGIVTGNLISNNYNGGNVGTAQLFLNFSGKLNDLRHYSSLVCRFVNCSIESNTVLFQNLDTTNLDGRFVFENCILKQVTVGNIITGNASTIHVFGTLKTNQVLTTTLTVTSKTTNSY
jgi:hypothetical protein